MSLGRDQWRRLEEVFQVAVEMDALERDRYLSEACRDEPGLRRRVESMIASSGAGKAWIEEAIGEGAARLAADKALGRGERLGAYRIVEKLGRGGMGEVYLAERADGQFEQRVAIKLVRGEITTPGLVERFRTERQILARLEHPNIARLLDGGQTAAGAPYLVMELIDGEPITEYCERRGLSIDERLGLFRTVCASVGYAHRNLVVHRDLKPSNILVTSSGVPRLLDFGIAKLLEVDSGLGTPALTVTCGLPLTPEYASPEQVRGEPVTTASDVYSLGVVLYEILTGRLPYDIEDRRLQGIERIVCEQVPPRPSTAVTGTAAPDRGATPTAAAAKEMSHRLAGDLDNIVLMALRKESERRYSSVEQLDEDIRRHQAGLPVLARPATLRYQAHKFVQRHRLGVLSAALVAVLIAALVSYYTVRLRGERNRARIEARKASAVAEFLGELFEVSTPERARGAEITARELLDRGAERIETELGEQPEVRAQMLDLIGETYRKLGIFDRARLHLDSALAVRREGEGELGPGVAETLAHLGRLDLDEMRWQDAVTRLEHALEIERGRAEPVPTRVAVALSDLGWAYSQSDRLDEAERLLTESRTVLEESRGPEHPEVADVIHRLGNVSWLRGQLDEAEARFASALAIRERALPADHPAVAEALHSHASARMALGRGDEAEPELREAIEIYEQALGEDHATLAWTLNTLAALYTQQKRHEDAVAVLGRVASIYETVQGPTGTGVGIARGNLGRLYLRLGRNDEAERECRRSVEILEQGERPRNVAWALSTLAAVYAATDRLEAAIPVQARAATMREEALGPEHPSLVGYWLGLAELHRRAGRPDEARPLLERAIALQERTLGADDPAAAESRRKLAELVDS